MTLPDDDRDTLRLHGMLLSPAAREQFTTAARSNRTVLDDPHASPDELRAALVRSSEALTTAERELAEDGLVWPGEGPR